MKSSVEEVSPLERKINIEIPVETITESFTKMLQNIRRDVTIKGYRKGKAPLDVVKKMYIDRVNQDVLQDLVHRGYYNSIVEHKLEPISQPEFEVDRLEEDKSFSFTAKIEVRPEVELKKYEGLPVEKEKFDLEDARIDEVIENICNSRAESVAVFEDRPVADGDIVSIDFEGFLESGPLPNGKAEGYELEIGTNSFIEGFEEGLIGMKAGDERTLSLKFPDEYHAADVAGQPVTFKVRLVALKKKSIPELTDDFVKTLEGPYNTVEELRSGIKDDLAKNEESRIKEDLKNRLLKELVRLNPTEVPPSMLADQKQALIKDFQQRMKSQGMSDEDFAEYCRKWDHDFESSANQLIQSFFLVDSISKKHELAASTDDLEERMTTMAKNAGVELKQVQEYYNDDERKNRLAFQVTEQKVVDFLLSSANIVEVDREKLQAAE